ncbi:helix-turn-helix domain-containing protein [Paraburkholderia sp.]|uniref:helix-turn-helix domain-containing protein n=1 Tax=Paraburkholderia sp. TaxID=1926495 RepID=UPI003C7BAFC0
MKTIFQLFETGAEDVFIGRIQFNGQIGCPLPLAYVVVLICQQGSAEWEVKFQAYRIEKNDFLVLAEDSIALIKGMSNNFSCNCYLMSRPIAAEIADGLPSSLFAYLNRSPFLASKTHFLSYLAAWEQQAVMIQAHCTTHKRAMIINHVRNFFLWICETAGDINTSVNSDFGRSEAICWKFWELISAHHKRQRAVAFYARHLHVTPYYLSQLTRKFFNDSPKTLIDRQVVLEIKKQLAQPGKSVQKIAEDLHFADASYLGKYFKRHTGVGLTEYRKQRN